MRTTFTTALLLVVSLSLSALACSDDAEDNLNPQPDASGQVTSDAGATSDAQPRADAMPQPLADAMPQAALGELCGQDAEGITCGTELACCYPCGIPGCEFTCTQACDDGDPGCFGGCFALP